MINSSRLVETFQSHTADFCIQIYNSEPSLNFVGLYTSAGVQNTTMEASNNNDPKSIQHKEDKHPPRKPTKGDPSESGNQEVKERPNVQSQLDEGSSGRKKNSSERKSVVEEDCYESLVKDTPKKRRPERRTDLLSPAGGIITSAEILNARADQYGWLWRKVGIFRSRERFWALLYHKVIRYVSLSNPVCIILT